MPIPFWARPPVVLAILLLYLLVHFAIRMAMGPALAVDDAWQALSSQHFAWAYSYRAPPLFTWILAAFAAIAPPGARLLALMRYALIGLTLGALYLTARRLIADPRLAALAVFSFAAINPIAEASHRNLTHSTALAALVGVAWYVFVRLTADPRLGWYLALGAAFGLGMLAKWNFVILAAALPLACLSSPRGRRLVLTWKVIPAAFVAALLVLPTVIATIRIGPPAGSGLAALLHAASGPHLAQTAEGTLQLVHTALVFSLPFLPILLVLFAPALWRGLRGEETGGDGRPDVFLVGMSMAAGMALLWGFVVFFGATEFKVRYLYPVLLILPVWAFMLLDRGGPPRRMLAVYALVLAALAVFVAGKRAAQIFGAADCGLCAEWRPYPALARQLAEEGYRGDGTILAGIMTGGNLRAAFPDARIVSPAAPPEAFPRPLGAGQCLLIWPEEAAPDLSDATERELDLYLAGAMRGEPEAPHTEGDVAAPMAAPATGEFRLNYRLYDGPNGACR